MVGLAVGVVAFGAVAVLALGLTAPVRVAGDVAEAASDTTKEAGASVGRPAADDSAPAHPPLAELVRLSQLDLRRPLYDPPAEETEQAASPKPATTMPVRLVGTVHEPGHSMAIFQKSNGLIEFAGPGQHIEDAGAKVTIVEVGRKTVTVAYGGASHQLTVPQHAAEAGRP